MIAQVEERLISLFPYKTNLDDLFRAGNLQINEDDVVVEIIGLANKAMLETEPTKTTVVFREQGKRDVLSRPFHEFIHTHVPKAQEFEIWLGWYRATGDNIPAHIVGKQVASTFNEAVTLYHEGMDSLDSLWYYNGRWELKGYGPFYTNGDDARAP